MDILEVLEQVRKLLQQKGRITYRILKMQYQLDDEQLDAIKEELIDAEEVAADKDGKMLVWAGSPESSVQRLESEKPKPLGTGQPLDSGLSDFVSRPPVSYTPAHLAERIRAVAVTDGERKTITALFADLKGSTALIEGLDPEEARAILDPALQLMMDAAHQYDGFVAQALGDGIFALFGAPIAHEDHPQRALYAALRMQEEMRRYSGQVRLQHGVPLYMRVGINTGEVVVRSIRKDDLHTDYVPVGHSTNLAARMEQMATPGTIVVTDYTHKLTDGFFEFKVLGAATIKGVEEPLNVYEVLGAGPLRTRLQVSASRYGLTRFVGRQGELEQLNKALEQAKAGHGQIVGTMGEPGLGKSRLFYEFKLLSLSGCLVLEAYSVSHGKATAYLPVIELLKNYFDIQTSDDERKRREKVTGKVLNLDRSLEDTLPYLFALLGIEEQPSPLAQMDPQIRRKRTFEALKKLFLCESLNQPLVLIFEDLHWIDGETQGFLDILSESVASAKILLLTNYRPEYRHEWGQKTYYTQLRLAPLGQVEAEELLDVLLGTPVGAGLVPAHAGRPQESPLQDLKQLILDKTQGTPFFMEEIVQELVEQGVLVRATVGAGLVPAHTGRPQGSPLHIPTTVQAVLAARIDRLTPEEKALLQQLSVIGRDFPLSLVRQVIAQSEADLYRLLASLQHKEFLYEQPAFPESEYIFKHALTQEVAYGTVLQEQRKTLHERIGQALEVLYQENLDDHYSELARHYSQSGNADKAVEYLHLAGQQAVQRSAHEEAIHHLTNALEFLVILPDTPGRAEREFAIRILLGGLLQTTRGPGAPEVESAYTRARELGEQDGDTPSSVLTGLWGVRLLRSEYQTALELAEQFFRQVEHSDDEEHLLYARWMRGASLLYLADLRQARTCLEENIALYVPQKHHPYSLAYGQDLGVTCLSLVAWVLWFLGYPDQARQRSEESVALAQELAHPYSLVWALNWAAVGHQFCREVSLAQQKTEAAASLATERGFTLWSAQAIFWWGWTQLEQGQPEVAFSQMHQGLEAWKNTGAEVWRPWFLHMLAEAYGKSGQIGKGLRILSEGLALVHKSGDVIWEAELYRFKGVLTLEAEGWRLETSPPSSQAPSLKPQVPKEVEQEAEECFLKAIAIAQKQQAKSWELRSATSLARLWQSQGKTTEARDLLAPVYNWFTEGFDTADLKDAKALLDELV